MHILVTRPEPDAGDVGRRLAALGHEVTVAPLLRAEPTAAAGPDLTGVGLLIATSRNALFALEATGGLPLARAIPLLAVGPATAAAASALGFDCVIEGPGTAAELPAVVAGARPSGVVLHLAGEEIAFDLVPALRALGLPARAEVLYRMQPAASLPETAVGALQCRAIDAVILMSPRTAAVYAELVARHRLEPAVRSMSHLCLSASVAARLAPLGDVVKAVCAKPNLEEMLALVASLAAQLR